MFFIFHNPQALTFNLNQSDYWWLWLWLWYFLSEVFNYSAYIVIIAKDNNAFLYWWAVERWSSCCFMKLKSGTGLPLMINKIRITSFSEDLVSSAFHLYKRWELSPSLTINPHQRLSISGRTLHCVLSMYRMCVSCVYLVMVIVWSCYCMGRETGARREEGSQGWVGEVRMNESWEENSNKYILTA